MNETQASTSSSYVAIDFETLFPKYESVCAVGMVKFAGQIILGQFYSLIRPPEEFCVGRCNSDIHGITPDMLAEAPSFDAVFPQIVDFVGNAIPVAHNASMERTCFEKCCLLYHLEKPVWTECFEDTYQLSGMKLVDACKEAGIETDRHHDPLQDAMMCARLHMHLFGLSPLVPEPSENARERRKWSHKPKCFPEDLVPLPENEVENKDTIFFRAHVVYTGEFSDFPDRRELGSVLRRLGAKVELKLTQKTKYLLCGNNPGPRKLQQALEKGIPLIKEPDFYQILEKSAAGQ